MTRIRALASALSASLAMTAVNAHAGYFNDIWFDPQRPGRAIAIEDQGDAVFALLFQYGPDGQPRWLVAPDLRAEEFSDVVEGNLYRLAAIAGAGKSGPTLDYVDYFYVALGLVVGGEFKARYFRQGEPDTHDVVRYVYGRPSVCWPGETPTFENTSFQGTWWNRNEPGWAIQLSHQTTERGGTLFALLATKDAEGQSTWLVASELPQTSDGSFAGKLHRTRVPVADLPAGNTFESEEVGDMRLAFSTATTGDLSYTVNGVSVSTPIERYFFGTQPTICSR